MAVNVIPFRPGRPRLLHHVALCPRDLPKSLQFYRDGIGLTVLTDEVFPGAYRHLLNLPCEELRSIFLGDPAHPHMGIVELVEFRALEEAPKSPSYDFFWLSFWVDVATTVRRLEELSLCHDLRTVDIDAHTYMATIQDPNGIRIELIPNSISTIS